MPFLSLSYTNFRNLENKTIDLLAKEVFFVGDNGQGKSNLLESLYMASYGSSFRTRSDAEIVKKGQSEYAIRSFYRHVNDKTDSIALTWHQGKKKILKNGKILKDRKELVNTIPCVLFCHEDLDFAVGAPERRRFFVDQALSMYDILYIDISRRYKKVLKSRNAILKTNNPSWDMLEVYDKTLIDAGVDIVKKRASVINQFNTVYHRLYHDITGIEGVSLKYESSWSNKNKDEIKELLLSKRDSDFVMKTTMCGPHRDRISFVKDKKNFITTASTGQRRLAALLLRICQAIHYGEVTQKKPVLLMDDVLLELDPHKRRKITAMLPEYEQLCCTFLTGEPYESYKRSTTKIFNVENGAWDELRG